MAVLLGEWSIPNDILFCRCCHVENAWKICNSSGMDFDQNQIRLIRTRLWGYKRWQPTRGNARSWEAIHSDMLDSGIEGLEADVDGKAKFVPDTLRRFAEGKQSTKQESIRLIAAFLELKGFLSSSEIAAASLVQSADHQSSGVGIAKPQWEADNPLLTVLTGVWRMHMENAPRGFAEEVIIEVLPRHMVDGILLVADGSYRYGRTTGVDLVRSNCIRGLAYPMNSDGFAFVIRDEMDATNGIILPVSGLFGKTNQFMSLTNIDRFKKWMRLEEERRESDEQLPRVGSGNLFSVDLPYFRFYKVASL